MTRIARLPLALAATLAFTAAPAFAQTHSETFDETVFFGDSLTDAGFFQPLLVQNYGSSASILGRFTTNPGLVWSEYLADYYGTNAQSASYATGATPRAGTGDNYAVGGARVGTCLLYTSPSPRDRTRLWSPFSAL